MHCMCSMQPQTDYHCKREVEEEEAMALAQVQSLVEADQPHPPISIAPPSETVVVHVQPDMVNPLLPITRCCYEIVHLVARRM